VHAWLQRRWRAFKYNDRQSRFRAVPAGAIRYAQRTHHVYCLAEQRADEYSASAKREFDPPARSAAGSWLPNRGKFQQHALVSACAAQQINTMVKPTSAGLFKGLASVRLVVLLLYSLPASRASLKGFKATFKESQ